MAIIILLALFALMWFVLILPRQRELKRHRALVAALDVGDEVMTTSGIYGTITSLEADELRLMVAPGLELRMARRAVASKVAAPVEETVGELDPADDPALPDSTEDPPPDETKS